MNNSEINAEKQILYWQSSSEEDGAVGNGLVKDGKVRHGLFFVHLALEKLLNAHVCKTTNDFAPKTHALLRLAELSGLSASDDQLDFLATFDQYNLAGRYLEMMGHLHQKMKPSAS